jgi:propanol-preferring alcohol dehydrogenase
MATMTALRLLDWQRSELVEVVVPEPAPGEVLVRVGGSGLCHSDLQFMDAPAGTFGYSLPFTLGHETAGWVERVGAGVDDITPGTAVIAAAHNWCERCEFCRRGQDNYCLNPSPGAGYGADGGLAAYVALPRNVLLPLGDLEPRTAAPLADAGATAYHAVKALRPRLAADPSVLVIGAGGLGGYAIQFLRLLTSARVTAVDLGPSQLDTARRLGAQEARLTSEIGPPADLHFDAVLDFVTSDDTAALAMACARPAGTVVFVGAGPGAARVGWGTAPPECAVYTSLGNTVADLRDVVGYARRGELTVLTETFGLDEVEAAYDRMRQGTLRGRAVVVFD